MKAIFFEKFGARDVLQFGDRPDPTPDSNELLIEVERSSVNFVDIRERQGTYNRPETHVGGIELPHVSRRVAEVVVNHVHNDRDPSGVSRIDEVAKSIWAAEFGLDREDAGCMCTGA